MSLGGPQTVIICKILFTPFPGTDFHPLWGNEGSDIHSTKGKGGRWAHCEDYSGSPTVQLQQVQPGFRRSALWFRQQLVSSSRTRAFSRLLFLSASLPLNEQAPKRQMFTNDLESVAHISLFSLLSIWWQGELYQLSLSQNWLTKGLTEGTCKNTDFCRFLLRTTLNTASCSFYVSIFSP